MRRLRHADPSQLLHEVWGPNYDTETHYLRVYLTQLRRKLEPKPRATTLPDHRARHGILFRGVKLNLVGCLAKLVL